MEVKIECPCRGKPHRTGDIVTLRDTLSFQQAASVRRMIGFVESDDESARAAANYAALSEGYLLFGIEAWTLTDHEKNAIPVSHANIREHLLTLPLQASIVSDAADELYAPLVLLPLLARASKSSPPTLTEDSTSATSGSTTKPRKRSKPSLTSTTRMDDTGTTSALPASASSS